MKLVGMKLKTVLLLCKQEFVQTEKTLQQMTYMDSFPFPYYIVLRDIEALPRTLGDVLRQVTFSSSTSCSCLEKERALSNI